MHTGWSQDPRTTALVGVCSYFPALGAATQAPAEPLRLVLEIQALAQSGFSEWATACPWELILSPLHHHLPPE